MYELHPTLLTFQEVPPLDIALRNDTAVILDHGSHIIVWLGDSIPREDSDSQEDGAEAVAIRKPRNCQSFLHSCECYAEFLSRGRAPIPELRVVGAGYDDVGWILSRVIPARKDSFPDQKNQFPSTIALDPRRAEEICQSFVIPREPSLYEWCRASCVEPPRQDVATIGSMSGL